MTLELMEWSDDSPGKDKSWVTRRFGANDLSSWMPICSATPIGEITRFGISCTASVGSINSQPFNISLEMAWAKNSLCFSADLWFPRFKAASASSSFILLSTSSRSHFDPFSSILLSVGHLWWCCNSCSSCDVGLNSDP